MECEFYLSWPPSINNYYVKTKRGVFISQKGRKYREQVAEAINGQLSNLHIDYKVYFEAVLYPPDKRIRDLDNYLKPMLDAITVAKLWDDDVQVDQIFLLRGNVNRPKGSVFIRLCEAGPIVPLKNSPL